MGGRIPFDGDFDADDHERLDPEQVELDDMPSSDREELQRSPHLAYVVLYCSDVEELSEFYEGTFGFERVYETGETVELRAGALTLTLTDERNLIDVVGLAAVPNPHDERVSLSFLVEDVQAVFEAAVELGAVAVREPHDTPWGMRSAYLRDPAGHLLEVGRWMRAPH
jgi:lactoylglutathione lyase